MFRIITGIICLFILAGCGFQHFAYLEMPNGQVIKAKMAITPYEKVTGLSNLPSISKKEGMLFIEKEPQAVRFWMKGMRFPLDIIFLNRDKKVLEIHAGEQPCSETEDCQIIESATGDVQYGLEVASGAAKELGIELNSILKW